jgi:peptide/nickel transport system permease protein
MTSVRRAAAILLASIYVVCLFPGWVAPFDYAHQFRDLVAAPPSARHPLGTDALGRDSLSRLIYASRVSLLLAPAAALLATAIAALMGGVAGYCGGGVETVAMKATDLVLSLPWLFVLLIARARMPLSMLPWQTIGITFILLGSFGWAGAARVICAAAASLRSSDMLLHAKACGCPRWRLFAVHVLPNLRSILLAQFLILIPVFILTEGNLGVLGLGVGEPLPSWGNLLRELMNLPAVAERPWMLAPLAVFAMVTGCFYLLTSPGDYT